MKIRAANDNDFKLGRGNQRHPGNKKCQALISTYKKEFVMAQNDRAKRDAIIHIVYKQITVVGKGRFVEKNEDGSYTVKSKDVAHQKIKKALSENNATVKAHLEMRGMLPSKGGKRKIGLDAAKAKGTSTRITKVDWLKFSGVISSIDESNFDESSSSPSKSTKKLTKKSTTSTRRLEGLQTTFWRLVIVYLMQEIWACHVLIRLGIICLSFGCVLQSMSIGLFLLGSVPKLFGVGFMLIIVPFRKMMRLKTPRNYRSISIAPNKQLVSTDACCRPSVHTLNRIRGVWMGRRRLHLLCRNEQDIALEFIYSFC
jgi:hypothetical protein